MMTRINTFLFLTVLTATISMISIASAEAQAGIEWAGGTFFDLSDSDPADGFLTIQGFLNPDGFSITSVHLDGATLRCRRSHEEIRQDFPEAAYVVAVTPKANVFVVQAVEEDGTIAYAVSGTIKPADGNSLRATVNVTRSRVFFAGPNDANANAELCTARLAFRSLLVIE